MLKYYFIKNKMCNGGASVLLVCQLYTELVITMMSQRYSYIDLFDVLLHVSVGKS